MRRWLACWGLCCALAGCEGDDPAIHQEEDAGGELVGDAGGKLALPPGIGDGETGTHRAASGSGVSRDPGVSTAYAPPSASMSPTSGSVPVVASGDAASRGASTTGTSAVDAGLQTSLLPGTLTAGTWDDNRNFERFQSYRADPVRASLPGILPLSDSELIEAHTQHGAPSTPRKRLDVALVIDTTGSMGDEIRYLQTEFVSISQAIEQAYPQAEQRWALVLYRDEGDEYLTRYFDFRSDPAAFREKLAAQSANGGGDFPEAPHAAFEILDQFAWRADRDVAKLAFWVADAPHHEQNAGKLAAALRGAHTQNIHVYPVASSGVDDLTELTMRTAALLTGGRYLFLTDDSGVGGIHKEPTIPCYFVTKLDDALLRMVDIELSGSYREPEPSEVLRASGDPSAGVCTLSGGQRLQVY